MATATTNGKVTVTQPTSDLFVYDGRRSYSAQNVRGLDPLSEVGTSGLRQYGGFVLEEWLPTLQGKRGAWAYREMMDNSAVIGGILYAIEMLARAVEWTVEGSDEKMPNGMLATEFVETCMHDMNHTWGDVVSEILSFLPYGWSFHEEVFKKRMGQQPMPPMVTTYDVISETQEPEELPSSNYDDGLIGWRKMPVRAQETLLRWGFTGYSQVRYMEQIDWHGGRHCIPIEKGLLFRTKALRGNPEGRSILRNAYQAYYYIQNIQNLEAIGIERDLAGLPKLTPPPNVDLYHDSNKQLLQQVQRMMAAIKRDENEGLILPTAGWEFELVSAGGQRQINTDDILRRYRQEMAASMLADFFLVGLDGLGSYAMVDIKSDLFGLSMNATLDIICDIFSRHAIPRLMALNGAKLKENPRLNHGNAGRIDIERVGQFLLNIATAGGEIPWSPQMIAQLLMGAGLPAVFDGESASTDLVGNKAQKEKQQAEKDKEEEKEKEPVEKADTRVTDALKKRHALLSKQLETEVKGALTSLGDKAANAYLVHSKKGEAESVTGRIIRTLDLPNWADGHLGLILRNHHSRVHMDTQRILQDECGPEMRFDVEKAGDSEFSAVDIQPQVRDAIMKAIEDGASRGESSMRVARRIRAYVPAGRFTKAGPKYRSQLISRNETARLQREAILKAYEANPHVSAVRVRDGIYGPPRSDSQCMDRDGMIVPISRAASVLPYHPLCTLSFDPIIKE